MSDDDDFELPVIIHQLRRAHRKYTTRLDTHSPNCRDPTDASPAFTRSRPQARVTFSVRSICKKINILQRHSLKDCYYNCTIIAML